MAVHVIHFSGNINTISGERIRDFALEAMAKKADELRLHFASPGGQTADSFALYGFLRSLPIPLVIHSIGNVESMGVVVFLAGSKRLICPHSRFLIHPLHWTYNAGNVDHARLRENLTSLDNDLSRYTQIFDERTKGAKKPLKIRRHLSGKEKIITATAAIDCGLAHEIAEAVIPDDAITWWVTAQ